MNKIYVVYITQYKGTNLPKWYIGSTYEKKIQNGYNGSICSKKWKYIYDKEQKENKHLFITKIISSHNTRKDALTEELRVQRMHSVMTNDNYFNESYATINGYFGRDVSGKNNPRYQVEWTDESRNKISNTINKTGQNKGKNNPNYGNKWTDEQKRNMSEKKKGQIPHNKILYTVFDSYNNIVFDKICKSEVRNINKSLINTSYEKRLGSTSVAIGHLKKNKKMHLINWYAVEYK